MVELVAKDDEYDDEVELEKLRRRRFVFLLAGVVCTSSSVSSSVVLVALSRIFRRRFRGARLLLPLLVVAAAAAATVVVVFDDEDVSDLRLFFIAKNRKEKFLSLANYYAIMQGYFLRAYVLMMSGRRDLSCPFPMTRMSCFPSLLLTYYFPSRAPPSMQRATAYQRIRP
jgi:hypothetical protein